MHGRLHGLVARGTEADGMKQCHGLTPAESPLQVLEREATETVVRVPLLGTELHERLSTEIFQDWHGVARLEYVEGDEDLEEDEKQKQEDRRSSVEGFECRSWQLPSCDQEEVGEVEDDEDDEDRPTSMRVYFHLLTRHASHSTHRDEKRSDTPDQTSGAVWE